MHAFVYRYGTIGVRRTLPKLTTALPLAEGPRKVLTAAIAQTAQHHPESGRWLVPGVPEAGPDDAAAYQAVMAFRARFLARVAELQARVARPFRKEAV